MVKNMKALLLFSEENKIQDKKYLLFNYCR